MLKLGSPQIKSQLLVSKNRVDLSIGLTYTQCEILTSY